MVQEEFFSVKNQEATRLHRRNFWLVRRFGVPENALGGHLSRTMRRCGKPTCHGSQGEGHPVWTLSYSSGGNKRVETLPADLAAELLPLVEQGREVREAVMEVLASTTPQFAVAALVARTAPWPSPAGEAPA